jgi:hypothetical protein
VPERQQETPGPGEYGAASDTGLICPLLMEDDFFSKNRQKMAIFGPKWPKIVKKWHF